MAELESEDVNEVEILFSHLCTSSIKVVLIHICFGDIVAQCMISIKEYLKCYVQSCCQDVVSIA